jgi:hypothetical protein
MVEQKLADERLFWSLGLQTDLVTSPAGQTPPNLEIS